MKIKITNIKWDTDGQKVKLPKEEIYEIDNDYLTDILEDDMNDYLSDKYGYCMDSYNCEIVEEPNENVQLLIEDVLASNFCEDNVEQYIKYLDKDLDMVEFFKQKNQLDDILAKHLIEEIELLKDIIQTIYKGENR